VNSFTSTSDSSATQSRMMASYLRYFAGFMLLLLAGLLASSYWIDPYGVWQASDSWPRKVAAADKVRQIKSYQGARQDPAVLIVGNSRVEIGLPPSHPFYQGRVYNLGLPGAGVVMQYDYAWHLIRSGSGVKQLLLAVDFVDFLNDKPTDLSLKGDWQQRLDYWLAAPDRAQPNRWLQATEQLSLLFSQTALQDSAFTLLGQQRDLNALAVNGFNDGRLYHNIVRTEGFAALYQQKIAELEQRLQRPGLGFDLAGKELLALDTFLQLLQRQGIAVTLFINPYQYQYLDLIEQHGLQPAFVAWKNAVQQVAARYHLPLYDFAIRSEPVSTAVTLASKRLQDNRYFWEPAHYRRAFGELMLDVWQQQRCKLRVEGRELTLCQLYLPAAQPAP